MSTAAQMVCLSDAGSILLLCSVMYGTSSKHVRGLGGDICREAYVFRM